MNDIIIKDISQIDLKNTFFHYTNKDNLKNIIEKGLEPRIGENALYVEKTPKVFFSIGEHGIIALMDVWLRWLTGKISAGKLAYYLGTVIYMRIPFCIKSIPNAIVRKSLNSQKKRLLAYSSFEETLENSIFLILNLEENIDFSYNDIDEVKKTYYKSFLKLLYPINSDLKDVRMEYWNMHTFSNTIIDSKKIALLKYGNTTNANKILINIIENNMSYVKNNFTFLYEYYFYIKNKNSIDLF